MYRTSNALKNARIVRSQRWHRRNIRFQSTTTSAGSSASNGGGAYASHALAGVAGGAVVVLAGYSYYHFSGTKKIIDGVKSMKDSFVQTTQTLKEKTPSSNEIVKYLRQTAKSYSMFIPGASQYVDSTFDSFDELASTHGQDVDKIIKDAYDELVPVVQNGKADQETAMKVFEILRRRANELKDVAARASSNFLEPIFESHPELKEKLGNSYDELRKLASAAGPEANKILQESSKQMKNVFSQGFNEKSIEQAKDALLNATKQVREMTEGTGKEAWEAAKKQAQPYLDKFPEIKDLLNEKSSVLMGSGAGAKAIWDRLKQLGEQKGQASQEKIEEVKDFIQEKVKEADNSSSDLWNKLQEFATAIPGADKVMEKQPMLKDFVLVLGDESEEAKQLAKETFSDVMNVLQEKAEKAKKLGQKAKEDTKEATTDKKDKKDKKDRK